MSEKKESLGSDVLTRIAVILGMLASFLVVLVYRGARRESTWSTGKLQIWAAYLGAILLIAYSPKWDVPSLICELPWIFPQYLGDWVSRHTARWFQAAFLFGGPFSLWLTTLGAIETLRILPVQKALDHLGMKTSTDLKPKVMRVIPIDKFQKRILVKAVGLDIAEFKSKKGAIESSLNSFVQDIRVSDGSRQVFEIKLAERELPTLIHYDEVMSHLTEPYSFLIGESMGGFLTTNLRKVRHMLVAGTSGGGKSFFVKQMLVGLLQSSEHIQLYLLDLKKGVEVKVFERLQNVFIAKDTVTAINTLNAVAQEMDRRFEYLEKRGFTEIDSKRDKLDRIVVLVDEASELFTVVKSSKAGKAAAESARDLADRIAKLGRVAGIHLVLATQKVIKETIDTRVQTNINARMVFRVPTPAASMTVLGNKQAFDLPDIEGRGIWSVGNRYLLVQAPRLDNQEVARKVNDLANKFNGENSPLFQKMLNIGSANANSPATGGNLNPDPGVNAEEGAF